jgi:hypothetical protein
MGSQSKFIWLFSSAIQKLLVTRKELMLQNNNDNNNNFICDDDAFGLSANKQFDSGEKNASIVLEKSSKPIMISCHREYIQW